MLQQIYHQAIHRGAEAVGALEGVRLTPGVVGRIQFGATPVAPAPTWARRFFASDFGRFLFRARRTGVGSVGSHLFATAKKGLLAHTLESLEDFGIAQPNCMGLFEISHTRDYESVEIEPLLLKSLCCPDRNPEALHEMH